MLMIFRVLSKEISRNLKTGNKTLDWQERNMTKIKRMKIFLEENETENAASLIAELIYQEVEKLIHQDNDNQLMTVEDLAEYLRVKKSWVYQKVHARELPFIKVGNKLRFSKVEIKEWLEKDCGR